MREKTLNSRDSQYITLRYTYSVEKIAGIQDVLVAVRPLHHFESMLK